MFITSVILKIFFKFFILLMYIYDNSKFVCYIRLIFLILDHVDIGNLYLIS